MVKNLFHVLQDAAKLNQKFLIGGAQSQSREDELKTINHEIGLYLEYLNKTGLGKINALGVSPAPDSCRTCGRKF